jgi:hypothetical protein
MCAQVKSTKVVTVPTRRPAVVSLARAAVTVLPITSGTATRLTFGQAEPLDHRIAPGACSFAV